MVVMALNVLFFCKWSPVYFAAVLDLTDEALLEEEVVQQPESKRSAVLIIIRTAKKPDYQGFHLGGGGKGETAPPPGYFVLPLESCRG